MSAVSTGAGLAERLSGLLVGKLHRVTPVPGIVSFTFDDPSVSACRTGARILEDAGVRGTWYLSLGNLAQSRDADRLAADDGSTLARDGHELGCRTHSGIDCETSESSDVVRDVERNARCGRDRFGESFVNFAYPTGGASPRTRRLLGRRFATCRGDVPGVNRGWVDLAQLRAHSLEGSDPLPGALESLNDVARNGGWLLFRLRALGAPGDSPGCWTQHLRCLVEAATRSGCRVLPVRSALAAIAFRV